VLAACRGAAQAGSIDYPRLVYPYIEEEMKLATPITLQRLCELGQASWAGFYRWRPAPPAVDSDLDLRDEIQRIALEWPCYGWRRIAEELHRRDWPVNHKRILRIMREDNLLCLRRRKLVMTTDSNHDRPVYPNLAGDMVLSGLDQLWVADITYIRLEVEFVYLALVLDASRRVNWLVSGAHVGGCVNAGGAGHGLARAPSNAGARDTSLRPWCAVCLDRLEFQREPTARPRQRE
jgi:hypothetical protein